MLRNHLGMGIANVGLIAPPPCHFSTLWRYWPFMEAEMEEVAQLTPERIHTIADNLGPKVRATYRRNDPTRQPRRSGREPANVIVIPVVLGSTPIA